MGSNFSLYGKDYRVSVNVQNNFQVLALKVCKSKKTKEDPQYVFYKKYTKLNLPEEFKQFNSIKSLYDFLELNKEKIEIVGTSLLIPLNQKQVYITFQNKSAQSKIFVEGVNEDIKQTNQAIQKLQKLTQILSKVQLLQNNQNLLQIQEDEENDLQFTYAKLYSFYEKLCEKNPQRKKTEKLSLINLVDQIVSEYYFLHAQKQPKEQINMKKAKPINQKQEEVQSLNRKIIKLQAMLQASKQTSQSLMSQVMKSHQEQIQKIKISTIEKQKNDFFIKFEGYVQKKRDIFAKQNIKQIKIKFQSEQDIKSYIEHRIDEIQQLKDQVLQEKNNVKILQKQIQHMRNGSSINFSNISGEQDGQSYI